MNAKKTPAKKTPTKKTTAKKTPTKKPSAAERTQPLFGDGMRDDEVPLPVGTAEELTAETLHPTLAQYARRCSARLLAGAKSPEPATLVRSAIVPMLHGTTPTYYHVAALYIPPLQHARKDSLDYDRTDLLARLLITATPLRSADLPIVLSCGECSDRTHAADAFRVELLNRFERVTSQLDNHAAHVAKGPEHLTRRDTP